MHLLKGEKQILVIRKHWFVLFQMTIGTIILIFIPFIFFKVFASGASLEITPYTTLDFEPDIAIIVFFSTLWIFIFWIRLFGIWTDYYLDKWIVTNQRVVDINQETFFNRQVYMFNIEKIQDITVDIQGFIPTLLNYGNLHVQTAGAAKDRHIIRGIKDPRKIRELLLKYYKETDKDDNL